MQKCLAWQASSIIYSFTENRSDNRPLRIALHPVTEEYYYGWATEGKKNISIIFLLLIIMLSPFLVRICPFLAFSGLPLFPCNPSSAIHAAASNRTVVIKVQMPDAPSSSMWFNNTSELLLSFILRITTKIRKYVRLIPKWKREKTLFLLKDAKRQEKTTRLKEIDERLYY